MQEMTLKDIQSVSLDILKDVHDFCMKHQINYSLTYGTLLGGVRHHGFIPWDDDVDIMMPRPDFDRFFELYHKEGKYKAAAPGENYMTIGRIYDSERTVIRTKIPWLDKECGVWIDIFPIDGVASNLKEHEANVKIMYSNYRKQLHRRRLVLPYSQLSWNYRWKKFLTSIGLHETLQSVLDKHLSMMQKYDFDHATYCSLLALPRNAVKVYFPKEVYNTFTDIEFEGEKFRTIKDYDILLSQIYGDYMQLPPKEEQVPDQFRYIKFYWKEQETAKQIDNNEQLLSSKPVA